MMEIVSYLIGSSII